MVAGRRALGSSNLAAAVFRRNVKAGVKRIVKMDIRDTSLISSAHRIDVRLSRNRGRAEMTGDCIHSSPEKHGERSFAELCAGSKRYLASVLMNRNQMQLAGI